MFGVKYIGKINTLVVCLTLSMVFHANYTYASVIDTACYVASNIDEHLEELTADPKKFINGSEDDNCVLAIIDAISEKAIEKGQAEYLDALNAIANISDGYVSEYFWEISAEQFYKNFDNLIPFLVSRSESDHLRTFIVQGLSMQISTEGNEKANSIDHFFKLQLERKDIPSETKKYIKQLQLDIDPSIFD